MDEQEAKKILNRISEQEVEIILKHYFPDADDSYTAMERMSVTHLANALLESGTLNGTMYRIGEGETAVNVNVYRASVDDPLSALVEQGMALEQFHPRAMKLLRKRKPFLVVAEDEPYYQQVYALIREHEQAAGRWTEDDERYYETVVGKTIPQGAEGD